MKKTLSLAAACLLTWQIAEAQLIGNLFSSFRGTPINITSYEGDGFKAEYYNGSNFDKKVFTRVDKKIDFFLIYRSPAEGISSDYFSIRWTGKVYAPKTGTYTFLFVADDGVRLWVNNQLIIDKWHLNRPTKFSGKVSLKGEQLYDIKIEYSQMKPNAAVAQASWKFEEEPESEFNPRYIFSKAPDITPVAAVTKTDVKAPAQKTTTSKPIAKTPVKKTNPEKTNTIAKVRPTEEKKTPAKPAVKTPLPAKTIDDANETEETFENLEAGKAVVLNHIFFDQSQHELKPGSYEELNKLANTLNKYPKLTITITGHTDNVGNFNLNVQLSKERAKAVADYLVKQGIDKQRIDYKGLGGLYPVAPNTTEENKMKNRRVEFAVR